MEVRILAPEEVHLAQKLAHDVFVVEKKWQIPPNPTQVHVEAGRLIDAYDAIATWIGAFEGENLAGCHRICRTLNDQFELEQYHPLPEFIKRTNAFEGTRLTIGKKYRSSTALLALAQFESQYLLEKDCEYFFTTSTFPRPGMLYKRWFGLIKYGEPFKYHADDLNEVYLYYIDKQGLQKLVERWKTSKTT